MRLAQGNVGWEITGNTGITAANFLGTINAADLIFRTSNTQRAVITSAGLVGLNTTEEYTDAERQAMLDKVKLPATRLRQRIAREEEELQKFRAELKAAEELEANENAKTAELQAIETNKYVERLKTLEQEAVKK